MICEGGGGAARSSERKDDEVGKGLVLHTCEKSRVSFILPPSSAKSNCRLVKFIDDIDLNGRVFAAIVGQKTQNMIGKTRRRDRWRGGRASPVDPNCSNCLNLKKLEEEGKGKRSFFGTKN